MAKKKKTISNKLIGSLVVIGILGVLGVGSLVGAFSGGAPKVVVEGNYLEAEQTQEEQLGVSAGPVKLNRQFFEAGFQSGGDTMSTTSDAASYTLLEDELDGDVSYIEWTPNVNTTLTTMASTSMSFLGEDAGDKRVYNLYNASSTTASTITFAAGTGVDLQEGEDETVIVNGLELAKLTFLRKSDSDVILLVEPYQVGD